MEKIILVRPGKSVILPVIEKLLPEGEKQIRELSQSDLKKIVGSNYFYVVDSGKTRTSQSAGIIHSVLNYPCQGLWFEMRDLFALHPNAKKMERIVEWIENNHPYKNKELGDGISLKGAIMVSHHTLIPGLAKYIGYRYQFDYEIPIEQIPEGHAIFLDLRQKTHEMLPRRIYAADSPHVIQI